MQKIISSQYYVNACLYFVICILTLLTLFVSPLDELFLYNYVLSLYSH